MAARTLDERKARSRTDARVRPAKPGKRCDLALGSGAPVSLAGARESAAGNRKAARAGGDPTAPASDSIVPTFAEPARFAGTVADTPHRSSRRCGAPAGFHPEARTEGGQEIQPGKRIGT